MTALRTAAQQALEAMRRAVPTGEITLADWMKANRDLEAALAEPVQEPVAYSEGRTLHWHKGKGVNDAQLYLAPPQRKPLTEEEIDSIWDSEKAFADIYAIARAIERAHGIMP